MKGEDGTPRLWLLTDGCYRSVLSSLTTSSTRSDVLAWYVTSSTLGSSIGSEASGRIIHFLQGRDGWTEVDAYHSLFWLYAAMGLANAALVFGLTDACELQTTKETYTRLAQDESGDVEVADPHGFPDIEAGVQPTRIWSTKIKSWFSNSLTQISAPTRSTMYKLWFLFAADSLADGMVPYSWTNYYMDQKFHPTKATLGDVNSASYGLAAVGSIFAGPLARKIGLINTMVFTHVPSSAAVLFFPLPPAFWMTTALLLIRAGLNNMDQAPRTAFIAAVVRPDERTACMGITSMVKSLAAMSGPTFTGILAAGDKFWIAFVVAGTCRLAYDFGLYAMFVNMKIDPEEGKPVIMPNGGHGGFEPDEEEDVVLEMQSLASSDGSDEKDDDGEIRSKEGYANSGLQLPAGPASGTRARSRSPYRSKP